MATKKTIVAICLMAAVLLTEARSAIHETPKTSRARFAQNKRVEGVPGTKIDPDAYLTTVREFHFIIITKEETMAV
jgi:hypothetical protein